MLLMAAISGEVNVCVLQLQLCINGKMFAGCKIIPSAWLPDNWDFTVLNPAL